MHLERDQTLLRWALLISLGIHALAALLLSLMLARWGPHERSIKLPQNSYVHEITLLSRIEKLPSKPTEPYTRSRTLPLQTPVEAKEPQTLDETETHIIESTTPEALSPEGLLVEQKTRVDTLFALLDQHPEFKNIILRELLLQQPQYPDSTELFRKSIAQALAHFRTTASQYGIIQRKDQIYVSPYDPFRPHGLKNNIDLIGLTIAIIYLIQRISEKE